MARDNQFSPEVHVLANTLCPRCVDQHLVIRWLRGVAQTSSTQFGHRKNLSISEVTQLHEQSTRVTFRRSVGKCINPPTITGDGHEQSPTHANPPPLHQAI